MDTRWASVYEAFWKNFTHFYVFDTTPSTCCVCHPSVAGFGMVWQTSSGKYTWFFVFTAPVAELNVVSFTVPFNVWTIAATATVVISCSSSADMCCESVCVAMSSGGGFTPGGAYDSVCDSVKPMTKVTIFIGRETKTHILPTKMNGKNR